MNLFEKAVHLLSVEMPTTHYPFGWFHILMFILMIAVTAIICIKLRIARNALFARLCS